MAERKYGWVKDKRDERDGWRLAAPPGETPDVFPPEHDLSPNFPEIYDQTITNTCTGQAIAAAFAYALWQEDLEPFDPSRLFIYWNERVLEGTTDEDDGAMIRDGFKALNKWGVCDETIWPFDPDKVLVKPGDDAFEAAAKHLAVAYHRVPQTLHDLKSTLYDGIPIVLGMRVYESFESEDVAKSGIVPMPVLNEQQKGGHAIVITGWKDDCFKGRNSWGPKWGQDGYFMVPEKYLVDPYLASDLWCMTLVS